jgi:nitric oxide dioxygenase
MTPAQIRLVQESFELVPAQAAASLFFDRLFEQAPQVRPLFTTDITAHGAKLMNMIGVAVRGLDNLETIVPAIRDLGVRHVRYGVRPEHYDTVGNVLLWTLDKGLGEVFTDEVRDAWAAAYGLLSSTMIEAAYSKAA